MSEINILPFIIDINKVDEIINKLKATFDFEKELEKLTSNTHIRILLCLYCLYIKNISNDNNSKKQIFKDNNDYNTWCKKVIDA